MRGYGLTNRGKVRKNNQDSFRLDLSGKNGAVAVVCDGMGGAKAGEVASDLAVNAFMPRVAEDLKAEAPQKTLDEILTEAVDRANAAVYERAVSDPDCSGMGTTLVGAIVSGGDCRVVNVGDSRAYLLTKTGAERVTNDHSVVEEMVRRGELTPQQAKSHPMKNLITRVLGADPAIECDLFAPALAPGNRLLLCSDGLCNTIADKELFEAHKKRKKPETLCKALVKLALERGASDNVTVVVLEK